MSSGAPDQSSSLTRLERRTLLKAGGIAAITAVGGGLIWRASLAEPEIAARLVTPRFLATICDIVLPATDTPGAAGAGVPAFLPTALRHGLFGGDGLTLGRFAAILDNTATTGSFLTLTPEAQTQIISQIDSATYAKRGPPDPNAPLEQRLWRSIKAGIVQSYYTTQVGGAEELTFELVPGRRYRADVAVEAVPYLSNYWIENVI